MKKAILFSSLLVLAFSVQAQRVNPVKWTYNAIKTATNQYDIVLTASIDAPWHMYSQFATKGPIPTTVTFKPNPLVKLNGKTKLSGTIEYMVCNDEKCLPPVTIPFEVTIQ